MTVENKTKPKLRDEGENILKLFCKKKKGV